MVTQLFMRSLFLASEIFLFVKDIVTQFDMYIYITQSARQFIWILINTLKGIANSNVKVLIFH